MFTINKLLPTLLVVSISWAEPLSSANNRLFVKLLNKLSDYQSNVFLSPFSISTALSMLYFGAKGETHQEMRQVLGYDWVQVVPNGDNVSLSDKEVKEEFKRIFSQIEELDEYELDIANKLVVQQDYQILDKYKEEVKNVFKSEVESQDFKNKPQEVMDSLNQWASRQTRNKIKTIIDKPLDRRTRLAVMNAIYFKANFKTKFNTYNTFDSKFYSSNNEEVKVKMMSRSGRFNFTRVPELDSQLLEVPYSGHSTSLFILLPNQRQGLKSLKNQLNDFSLIENKLSDLKEERVRLLMPKYKVETKYKLSDTLKAMGMKTAFNRESKPDFSGIDGKRDLYVSEVLHKAYIEVNEEGTEAAAVTTGIVAITPSVPKIIPFLVDHPFLFFIRDNRNGIVLFGGHIIKL